MATEIRVPKIEGFAERASIGRWFKRVGDPISIDDPMVEIETGCTTLEVRTSDSGVLSGILLRDGKKCKGRRHIGDDYAILKSKFFEKRL